MQKREKIDWETFDPVDPDLEAVEDWVGHLAKGFVKGGYRYPEWMEELASAGYADILEAWQGHRHKPVGEWKAYMTTVAINAMKGIISKENTLHGIPPKSEEPQPTGVSYSLATQAISEKDRLARLDLNGEVAATGGATVSTPQAFEEDIEKRQAVEVIMTYAKRLLPAMPYRALVGSYVYAGLLGEQIAEKLGMTHQSYRTNKTYAVAILRNALAGSY